MLKNEILSMKHLISCILVNVYAPLYDENVFMFVEENTISYYDILLDLHVCKNPIFLTLYSHKQPPVLRASDE